LVVTCPNFPRYTGHNTGAEITVAPSGRFVYASNRGHNSIAIFAVDWNSGALAPVSWASTERAGGTETVRFFSLDPAARVLYAANLDSDTIVPFDVDWETGMLTPNGHIVHVNSPCTIVFSAAQQEAMQHACSYFCSWSRRRRLPRRYGLSA
jgi:6-phosphogluconolactonase